MDPSTSLEWPPRGGAADRLFILLHGVGATPAHLVMLARRIGREHPGARVVGLAGAEPFDGGGDGRQWFSLTGITAENRPARVAAAMPFFLQRVRELQARHGLPWQRTVLVGFSQGALMALEAVQAEPALAAHVVAFAGRFATMPAHAPEGTVIHLLHGLDDDVVPAQPTLAGGERLAALGAAVFIDTLPGVGHELDARLVGRAMERLKGAAP